MKRKIGEFFLLFILASLALSGCFSPWKGDEATLTLLLGPASRAAIPDGVVHTIELEGPTGRQSYKAEGSKPFSVTVMPGYWHISIQASLDGKLYAEGEGGAQIKAGQDNLVEIKMSLVSTAGSAGITVNFIFKKDIGLILDNDEYKDQVIVISANDPDPRKKQFKATVNGGFNDVQWFIWGFPVSGNKDNKNQIIIKAEDYNPGTYQLTVKVIDKYDVPYSANITFEVRGE